MKKLLTIFGGVFVSYYLFNAGLGAAHRNFSSMVLSLIVAAFWFALASYVLWDAITGKFQEISEHRHEEMAEAFGKDLISPLDKAFGNDKPADEATPAADEAAVASEPRKVQIPVIDGDAPVPKPLTKSQQRRLNTKKGLGPLTDDEVREQKNEKRRAARAAKKAELEQTKLI